MIFIALCYYVPCLIVPSTAQFEELIGAGFPPMYEIFVTSIDLFSMNLGYILSFACIAETNYYDDLMYATIGPIVVLAGLYGVYRIAKRRNRHSETAMRAVQHRHVSIAIFVVFFLYSTVSRIIFEAFDCEKLDNNVTYLKADYSLICTSTEHRAYVAYAIVMIFVYPIGIPGVLSWWLWRNRGILKHESSQTSFARTLQTLRDLWEPYKPEVFFFEIVEYTRRFALTGLSVFILPGSTAQVAVILFLTVSFGLIAEVLSPFRRKIHAWLYRGGTCTIFLTVYLALLMKADVSTEDDHSQDVFMYVLIVVHVVLVLCVILNSFLWMTEHRAGRVASERPGVRFSMYSVTGTSARLHVHSYTKNPP